MGKRKVVSTKKTAKRNKSQPSGETSQQPIISNAHIDDITEDLLAKMFMHLDYDERIATVEAVSRRWNRVARQKAWTDVERYDTGHEAYTNQRYQRVSQTIYFQD